MRRDDQVLMLTRIRERWLAHGDNERHIPESYIDSEIANRQSEQFDNDRSKFLAYLRSRGTTIREFRSMQSSTSFITRCFT